MGSCSSFHKFEASDSATLIKNFRAYQQDLNFEYGNNIYGGHMGKKGLDITSMTFTDSQKAVDWISDNTDKHGNAKAVKVGDFSKAFPKTEAEKKLLSKLQTLESDILNFDKEIIKRVKSSKSATKSCEKCGSKIAVKFVKDVYCPVCGDSHFVKTATDLKKESTLRENLKEVTSKVHAAKKKYEQAGNQAYWLVGGWCPE